MKEKNEVLLITAGAFLLVAIGFLVYGLIQFVIGDFDVAFRAGVAMFLSYLVGAGFNYLAGKAT